MSLIVKPITAFEDNYIWAITSTIQSNFVVLVDPGCAKSTVAWLNQNQLIPESILITHHHGDHIGGVQEIVQRFPDCVVYASTHPAYLFPYIAVSPDSPIYLTCLKTNCTVFSLPGHTAKHIGFHFANEKLFFCGDTLFASGCGRVFDGTHSDLFNSIQTIASLDADTLIFPAHEYTYANVLFSLIIDPSNARAVYRKSVESLRNNQLPTLPTTVGHEIKYNLFMQCHTDLVISFCQSYAKKKLYKTHEVFYWLRTFKDKEFDPSY
ncbi:MAG: hydroxyacylglutathione hydrolase [Methylacidiphilales bacterium]|nr:hydroxyacylglutathione hydrolase [Candidatus Methylacidiphilales bacterium]